MTRERRPQRRRTWRAADRRRARLPSRPSPPDSSGAAIGPTKAAQPALPQGQTPGSAPPGGREEADALAAPPPLTHVWSEFGRRPQENGSGTDHGAGGISFLIGTRARGRMVGEFPGLATLDEDHNLRSTSDYRGLYRGLLEQWFAVDAAAIIPNASQFPAPALLKS